MAGELNATAFFPPRPFLVVVVGFSGEALAAGTALARVALPRFGFGDTGVSTLAGVSAGVVLEAVALPRVALAFLGGETCSSLTGEGEAFRFEVVFSGSDFPRREVRLTGSLAGGVISTCSGSLVAYKKNYCQRQQTAKGNIMI